MLFVTLKTGGGLLAGAGAVGAGRAGGSGRPGLGGGGSGGRPQHVDCAVLPS